MCICSIVASVVLSVTQFLTQSVDGRISDANDASLGRFLDYSANASRGKFVLNPGFWASGVDFSCASPWNEVSGALRAGTLISKRHVVFAKHFPLSKGARIVFVDNGGAACSVRIAGTKEIDGVDILIASLDSEVAPNIRPAKILPDDYRKYIGDGEGLPVATFNMKEQLVLSELSPIPTNRFMNIKCRIPIPEHIFTRKIEGGPKAALYRPLIVGDSGNPAFLIAGNEPILLYCNASNNASSGPPLHLYRQEIQAAMDTLCPGYKLETIDLAAISARVNKDVVK